MPYSKPTLAYVFSLIGLSAIILYLVINSVLANENSMELLVPIIIFASISLVTQIYEVELVFNRSMTTAITIFMAALLYGGLPLAVIVMTLSTVIAELILRSSSMAARPKRLATIVSFNTAQMAISSFCAAVVYQTMGGSSVFFGENNYVISDLTSLIPIVAAIAAFLVYSILNIALVSGMVSLVRKTNFTYHLRFNVRFLLVQVLSLGVLGILLAEVYSHSPINILLVLIPMGLVHVSLRNYMKLRHEAQNTFENVANMLSARDPYTYEHSEQVEDLAEQVARVLHFSEDEIGDIKAGALIHDIGKLAVPDRILLKPGPLTPEERSEMEKHPVIGAQLLENLEIYRNIVEIVRHEHEKWDGTGYPDGLKGEAIPLGARIIAAADIYNALTTDRPYRKAYSHDKAVEIIKDMSGSHLDPTVVNALLQVLGEIEEEPQPVFELVMETAVPFSPLLIALLILIVGLLTGTATEWDKTAAHSVILNLLS